MDIGAIRQALADAAATATPPLGTTKLASYGFTPGSPAVPAVFPVDSVGSYVEATNGVGGAVVTLRVLTSRSDEDFGQQVLNAYLADSGVSSLVRAIESGMPSAAVLTFDGYRAYDHANGSFWGAEIDVRIL